tara:strand:- start:1507 stop:1809 length:303 start_codon:yes stop_codon:yes gene_type:complete
MRSGVLAGRLLLSLPSPCDNMAETATASLAASPTSFSPISGRTLMQYDNLGLLPEETKAAPQDLLKVEEAYGEVKEPSWNQRMKIRYRMCDKERRIVSIV